MDYKERIKEVKELASSLKGKVLELKDFLKERGFIDQAIDIEDIISGESVSKLFSFIDSIQIQEDCNSCTVEEEQLELTPEQWEAYKKEKELLLNDPELPEEPEELQENFKRVKLVLDYINAPHRLYESLYSGNSTKALSYLKRYGVEVI